MSITTLSKTAVYKRTKTILWLFAMCLFSASAVSASSSVLQEFDGDIDEHTGKGKWLVVMLWASDCHVCNEEAHQYVAFHKKHMNTDAKVLNISLDDEENLKAAENFVQKHKLNFPNLIAEPLLGVHFYQQLTGKGWVGTPTFLVYNPKGKLLAAQAGAVPTEIIESFMAEETKAATQ